MKTSNKILFSAAAVFLTVLTAFSIFLYREYDKTEEYAQQLVQQLTDTQIRTLIIENSPGTEVTREEMTSPRPGQLISLNTTFKPSLATIQGDTLLIRNLPNAYLRLPYLENFIADGIPQPLPEKAQKRDRIHHD